MYRSQCIIAQRPEKPYLHKDNPGPGMGNEKVEASSRNKWPNFFPLLMSDKKIPTQNIMNIIQIDLDEQLTAHVGNSSSQLAKLRAASEQAAKMDKTTFIFANQHLFDPSAKDSAFPSRINCVSGNIGIAGDQKRF